MTRASIGQRGRLIILVVYVIGLFAASWTAFGTWVPPAGERGLWFYAALAALLLGNLLVTPFFTKPVDAISYAVAAVIALLGVNVWGSPGASGFDRLTWSAAVGYSALVLGAALLAISLKDSSRSSAQNLARSGLILADVLGSPRAIFSVVFFFALITYHRTELREYLVLSLAWMLFIGLQPLETLGELWRRLYAIWVRHRDLSIVGQVVGHESPGLVLIQEDPNAAASFGDIVLTRTESGNPGAAMVLDHLGFAGGRWRRAILVHTTGDGTGLSDQTVDRAVRGGAVYHAADDCMVTQTNPQATQWRERLIGFVAPDTTIGQLQIELVRELDVKQGSLVEVAAQGQPVLYQVINGLTKEEILREKNTRGYVRAQAKTVGVWNDSRKAFDPFSWLPRPNQPILLVQPAPTAIARDAIGVFPGTPYPVRIDESVLVTHNAAILGILGAGKTYLAMELVERMMRAGIKVVCLDLTDQYAAELVNFTDNAAEKEELETLASIGPTGRENVQQNVEEGGSIREFTNAVKEQIKKFLRDSHRMLKILNPSRLEVWRQENKPFHAQGSLQASMATLTPAEITRILTEVLLNVLQEQGMSDQARCCIVYEEAHSLIPEWNAAVSEAERAATNGTAKAILQGRKFGLGCLVITQRTANVTKSILNQCNTVFALRVFDATGMEFLKNYIGEDYAGVLSKLEDRHAVVFGRASSCRDPVLVKLNDRDEFIRAFRGAGDSQDLS